MAYNTSLEDRIDHFFIGHMQLTKKKQMGGVGWLINGNMCCGIYENLLVVRTDPQLVDELLTKPGIQLFSHRKDAEDSFLSIEKKLYVHDIALHKLLTHGLKYSTELPPKETDEIETDN